MCALLSLLLASCYPPPELGTEGWTAEAALPGRQRGTRGWQPAQGPGVLRLPRGPPPLRRVLAPGTAAGRPLPLQRAQIRRVARSSRALRQDLSARPQKRLCTLSARAQLLQFRQRISRKVSFRVTLADSDQEPLHKSFENFRQLVEQFPRSIYTGDARKRMFYLLDQMGLHELQNRSLLPGSRRLCRSSRPGQLPVAFTTPVRAMRRPPSRSWPRSTANWGSPTSPPRLKSGSESISRGRLPISASWVSFPSP